MREKADNEESIVLTIVYSWKNSFSIFLILFIIDGVGILDPSAIIIFIFQNHKFCTYIVQDVALNIDGIERRF